MKNRKVAKLLYEIAELLDVKGVQWKPRAYRSAAQAIEEMHVPIEKYFRENRLDEIPGVGESIEKKIIEFLKTGKLRYYQRLKSSVKISEDLLKLPNLGPKRISILLKKLNIRTKKDLISALKKSKLRKIKGFGLKIEQNLMEELNLGERKKTSYKLEELLPIAKRLEKKVRSIKGVRQASVAGSLRRKKPIVHDIDIIASSNNSNYVINAFVEFPEIKKVLSKGPVRATVKIQKNIRADLRVVSPKSYGAGLLYLTGSKHFSIRLRQIAIKFGYKLSEYGVFKGEKVIARRTEKEIFKKLKMPYIPPEKRN